MKSAFLSAPAVIALGLFALTPTVHAQQPPQGSASKMFMQQMDANKDGKVSKEEFLKPQEEMFKLIDKDGDGSVTEAEAAAFAQEMHQRMQQQMQPQQKP